MRVPLPSALSSSVVLAITLGLTGLAVGAVHVIQPDGSGDFATIQAALDFASDTDVIELADGEFAGPGNRDLSFGGEAVTVRSQSGDPSACVIDCGGSMAEPHRGFLFTSGETLAASVENVTIRNGHAGTGVGGGILCQGGSSPTITGCVFDSNGTDSVGGGLYATEGSAPAIVSCTFTQNFAFAGGGAGFGLSNASLEDCVFENNSATSGGGVGTYHIGTLTLTGCGFYGNSTDAINCFGGSTVTLENCTIADTDCLGAEEPAAVHAWSGAVLDLTTSIVAFTASGAAVSCPEGTVTLDCCDVFGNAGGDWVGCIAGQESLNDNFSLDPFFCDQGASDYTLRADSPCLPMNTACNQQVGAEGEGCAVVAAPALHPERAPRLAPNRPNPFNPSTVIRFDLPRVAHVKLCVYDTAGRLIATLRDEVAARGTHDVIWHGTDEAGRQVASGVYLASLTAEGRLLSRRMVLVE